MDNRNKRDDERDTAVNIAWKEFKMRHPIESWPEWFTKCFRIRGAKNDNNNWKIKLTVLPKPQLKPNQHWEDINGIPVVVSTDPVTGKEKVVICGGPAVDIEVLFEVEVDIMNKSATVIIDTELDVLDGTKYEICRR